MTSMRAFACFIAMITALTSVHGTVPIIDTLAAAYAETGDFASATRYAAQALTIKDITPDAKRIQQHLTLFQQNQPIRL